MYKHILIPLDNSPSDPAILDHIRVLARLTGARITLLHIADGFVARNQHQLNLAESPEIIEDRRYLAQRQSELQQSGFNVETLLECGEPAKLIVAAATRLNCDLIAMATHGHRLVADVLLGSVANDVRHHTDLPVLLIRSKSK